MKKISIVLNICFLGIIIFFGCEKETDRSATADCVGCRTYNRTDFNGIDYLTAKKMAEDYRKENWPKLSTTELPEDARSVWFSLETLKAFIYSIEKETCNSSCRKLTLGVRIYYGRYPHTIPIDYGVPPEYANRHTLFMVPTYQGATRDINFDFDPWNFNGGDSCKPFLDPSISGKRGFLAPYASSTEPVDIRAANHGDLIPPGSSSARFALTF